MNAIADLFNDNQLRTEQQLAETFSVSRITAATAELTGALDG
jgi:DNA-binding GntR family transcriptional regulator